MRVINAHQGGGVAGAIGDEAGYWKLDEGTGTTTADSSANGNNGTLTGTTKASWSANPTNGIQFANPYALDFTTTATMPVSIPHAAVLSPSTITLSLWVYDRSLTVNRSYINKGSRADYELRSGNSLGAIDFLFTDTGNTLHLFRSANGVITVNTWVHLRVSYTFGTASTMKVFKNGTQVSGGAWLLSNGNTANKKSTNPLLLAAGGAFGLMDGLLDDVRIFGREITSAENTTLAAGGPA